MIDAKKEINNMGLLAIFRKNNEEIDLNYVEDLFSTLSIGAPSSEKAKNFSKTHDRQEVLDEIIHIAKQYNSPRAKYINALAYGGSRVSHRKEAIHFINDYLLGPLYLEKGKHLSFLMPDGKYATSEEANNILTAELYRYLGKAYEGEYMFEAALETYKKMHSLDGRHLYSTLIPICEIYIKLGDIDTAISLVKNNKPYPSIRKEELRLENSVKKNYLEKYQSMKERNYVYKPRKK